MEFITISFSDQSLISLETKMEKPIKDIWNFWKEQVAINGVLLLKDTCDSGSIVIHISSKRFEEIVQVQTNKELIKLKNREIAYCVSV